MQYQILIILHHKQIKPPTNKRTGAIFYTHAARAPYVLSYSRTHAKQAKEAQTLQRYINLHFVQN